MFLEIVKAKYLGDYKILLDFNDGVSKAVDLKDELNGRVFEPLKEREFFQNFYIKFNTIAWENGADFAPEYLYQIGIEKSNELANKPNSQMV